MASLRPKLFHPSTFSLFHFLSETCPRAASLVALAAKNSTSYLGLERHLIVLTAMVTNYLESLGSLLARGGFFRSAFCAPLRRHHIPLVEHFLFLLREEKRLLALDTNSFNVRHLDSPYWTMG